MKWLSRFFGTYDKEQQERTDQVAGYVHNQKNTFAGEMKKIELQAKKVHKRTKEAHRESIRLLDVVNDVTTQIAEVTGASGRVRE
jgi:hypothetical protein